MDDVSAVITLQELAQSEATSLGELLRRAKTIATKLQLSDFQEWIDCELNGYHSKPVPLYRKIATTLKAVNPYHGYIPFVIDDDSLMATLCNVDIRDPIKSLQDLLEAPRSTSQMTVPFSSEQQARLMEFQGGVAPLESTRVVSRNQVAAIVEAVRTAVLDWALKLEQEGVMGYGMTFSREERHLAQTTHNVTINGPFQGTFGNVSDSHISQQLSMKVAPSDFESLAKSLERVQ